MNDVLQSKFDEVMAREGITVSTFIGGSGFQAFFRRLSDGLNQRDTMTMFYNADSPVKPGTLLVINGENFLTLNKETIENCVYKKSAVIRCNGEISTDNATVIGLPFYGEGVTSAYPDLNKLLSVIGGKTSIITEDCNLARRIAINDRYNAWGRTWKVQNVFYVGSIATIEVEVQADTEIEYTYGIELKDIEPSGYSVGDSVSLDAYGTINGLITDVTFTYTSSNTDVATIDNNGVISFVGVGSVSFTVAWQKQGITRTTTETTITEEASDSVTLEVSAMDSVYVGLFDGECTATIRRNGEEVHDIPFTAEVVDCDFANKITVTANQDTGKIIAHVASEAFNLANKTFTLLVKVSEYGLQEVQTVSIKNLL